MERQQQQEEEEEEEKEGGWPRSEVTASHGGHDVTAEAMKPHICCRMWRTLGRHPQKFVKHLLLQNCGKIRPSSGTGAGTTASSVPHRLVLLCCPQLHRCST
jgi:hypothetical protein